MLKLPFFHRPRGNRKNERGVGAPTLGIMFMTIAAFVGTAVDLARLQLVQSRLTFALDAAGLAAGATLNTTNLDEELTKFMSANFPANYMGAAAPELTSEVSADNMILNLSANTTMPTTFMGLFGINTMSVSARSEITRTSSGLELVMALDVTGSMNSGGKLTAMQNAAKSLVNILYGSKTEVEKLWIGLIPFSQTVNVGTDKKDAWIDTAHLATLGYGTTTNKTSWGGCVDARDTNDGDTTDTPPSQQKYKVYYSPSTDIRPEPYSPDDYYYSGGRWYSYNVNDWVYSWNANGTPKKLNSLSSTKGPNAYCPTVMTPMTGTKKTITDAIDALEARGNTHINLGAIWAWNMLSERWRGEWGGTMGATLPLDYGTKHMNKAAILLTDGDNTMSQPIYTAYGYLSDGRLGSSTSSTTAENSLDSKLSTVCTAMKGNGIYVYVIALGGSSDIGNATRTLLRNCASAPNYYFESPSAAELQNVFNAIADSLSNLRVSQ